jgi:hypothetical protein
MPHDQAGHEQETGAGPHASHEPDESFPWDADGHADPDTSPLDSGAPRERHDAFNEVKRAKFLKALVKTGCIAEACRRTGTAPRTVYNHQQANAEFLSYCTTAQRMAATPIEIAAWARAVDGIEETVIAGGRAVTRTRYSEHLLRLLLQASDPKRFGRNPGFTRKRMRAAERKEIEKEVRREERKKAFEEITEVVHRVKRERLAAKEAEAAEAAAAPDPQDSRPPAGAGDDLGTGTDLGTGGGA